MKEVPPNNDKEKRRELRPLVFVQLALVFSVFAVVAHYWPAVPLWFMAMAAFASILLGYLTLALFLVVWVTAICIVYREPPSDELMNWLCGVPRKNK